MKVDKDRCEHCGKWVVSQTLYTLYDKANEHPHREHIAICQPCYDKYDANYWEAWLNRRFEVSK